MKLQGATPGPYKIFHLKFAEVGVNSREAHPPYSIWLSGAARRPTRAILTSALTVRGLRGMNTTDC